MTMTVQKPVSGSVVLQSYGRCCMAPEFFHKFYDRFMQASPEIRRMFASTDMEQQRHALRSGIAFLIQYAQGVDYAAEKVRQLGLSHGRDRINVRPEYYQVWLQALVETIAECDPEYEFQLGALWRATLQKGIDRMMELY